MEKDIYTNISLLITHYNRPQSLLRLLESFEKLQMYFQEIVVSDDGSNADSLQSLRDIQARYSFRLLTSVKNRGLGHNMNKGQMAVSTPYTLYIQEDFIPTALFKLKLPYALSYMERDSSIDMSRFYAYFKYPSLIPLGGGFSKMVFKPLTFFSSYKKFYMYSDHPHLRKSDFILKFGPYPEGIKGDKTEYMMMMRFLKQKGQAIFYDDFQSLFIQENSRAEPSTMTRDQWRMSSNPFIAAVRHVYRHVKFNLDYFL